MFTSSSLPNTSSGFDLSRLLRRLALLIFAVIQAALVAHILLDLDVFSAGSGVEEFVVTMSDVLAAPVKGDGSGLSGMFGGSGLERIPGDGPNPVMVFVLAGWAVVEALLMRGVRKFDMV